MATKAEAKSVWASAGAKERELLGQQPKSVEMFQKMQKEMVIQNCNIIIIFKVPV